MKRRSRRSTEVLVAFFYLIVKLHRLIKFHISYQEASTLRAGTTQGASAEPKGGTHRNLALVPKGKPEGRKSGTFSGTNQINGYPETRPASRCFEGGLTADVLQRSGLAPTCPHGV
jgi:hypothetical protein